MRFLLIIICTSLLLISCRKDKALVYTSDAPNDYHTKIDAYYDESRNITTVYVAFSTQINDHDFQYLRLPSDSYLKVNGATVSWDVNYGYFHEFEGKSNCKVEFKTDDETVYTNLLVPPDTAFFVDLPDTVLVMDGFEFGVNPPLLDSNESNRISLNLHSDDYGNLFFGTDTVYYISGAYLNGVRDHLLYLYRIKRTAVPNLPNPHLPFGGGSVQYHYKIQEEFHSK